VIKNDLALIKSCLRLINASIKASGDNFSADPEVHKLIDDVEKMLIRIKNNIGSENDEQKRN
jgi:hypothetical protein